MSCDLTNLLQSVVNSVVIEACGALCSEQGSFRYFTIVEGTGVSPAEPQKQEKGESEQATKLSEGIW